MTLDERAVGSQDNDDERWFLVDQREFLLRSLEDADRERDAGDLSDEDHAVLVARDRARLAEVETELAAFAPTSAAGSPERSAPGAAMDRAEGESPSRPPWSLWRKLGLVAACLLILLGAGLLVSHFLQSGQPGQPLTGSVSTSQAQQISDELNQAITANNNGDVTTALNLYDKVLAQDPSDPAALAYAGYLEWNVGSKSHVPNLIKIGRAEIQKAVKIEPTFPEGHLFYGFVLANQDHDYPAAVVQFDEFLAAKPSASEAASAGPDVAPSYKAVGQPLPAGFGAASTSASSTTSTSAP